MKIIDKIRQSQAEGHPFFSFEYFPPKTEAGVTNLFQRVERMARLRPAFVDITWGAGGTTAERSLEIASHTQNLSGLDTMLHLTCTNMSKYDLMKVLSDARRAGIQNILALRGDPPKGKEEWEAHEDGFSYAIDLVRFIKKEHGDHFGICVAGYPEGHEESTSYLEDVQFLKQKVDAGADFIITQLFFDSGTYLQFVNDCRNAGITCPIIPGIMPIHNYRSFQRMAQFCTTLPAHILEALEPIQNDDEAVREYGVRVISEMCQELIENGAAGLHFYTMNLERVVAQIVSRLELVPENVSRSLPWLVAPNAKRANEDVRPIFWANRPKSYVARTLEWDEYPNGRWGDSRSPAFGDLTDHYFKRLHTVAKDRLEMWGHELESLEDIYNVFVRFCNGEIDAMPWFDSPLAIESEIIKDQLVRLNKRGLLTINSQPRVNSAPSSDSSVGWGGDNGIVYQKAYVEFFVAQDHIHALLEVFSRHPNITFHAINREGVSYTNCDTVNAVTWGVFPGKEIVQPTVVDPDSFMVWKDEAFGLWTSLWGSIYDQDSPSYKLIEHVRDTFFLVNVVDNDFVQGDIWALFNEVLQAMSFQPSQETLTIAQTAP